MSDPIPETVRQVAALARLELDAAEAAALGRQFGRILEQFQELAALDVAGVEPMLHAAQGENVVREDLPAPSLPREAALSNAPAPCDGFYSVPKTVGGEE